MSLNWLLLCFCLFQPCVSQLIVHTYGQQTRYVTSLTDCLKNEYNNNNNNNIISKTMFMVLSSWQSHCESSPGSFDECRTAPVPVSMCVVCTVGSSAVLVQRRCGRRGSQLFQRSIVAAPSCTHGHSTATHRPQDRSVFVCLSVCLSVCVT